MYFSHLLISYAKKKKKFLKSKLSNYIAIFFGKEQKKEKKIYIAILAFDHLKSLKIELVPRVH